LARNALILQPGKNGKYILLEHQISY